MKNKYNTLQKYIYEYSKREYGKETINGLFRSILEPLIANQKLEACVLFKLEDLEGKKSLIKRLAFSSSKIYSFNSKLDTVDNSIQNDIWANTEFVIILGQRYSAALIWDYSTSSFADSSEVCFLYNSKIITDIAKKVLENSKDNFKELVIKYAPDRRENFVLNSSVNSIVSLLDEKNNEFLCSEKEKNQIFISDDTMQTAKNVTDKAKFIAHEIKNSLSIINLYSTIMGKRLQNVQAVDDVLKSINNSLKNIMAASENVSSLINDLRCLSAPYLTEVSIKNLILNTVMLCKEKADKASVIITVENFEDFIINTDKTKLQCAITNIIFNAIEACTHGCEINIYTIVENDLLKIKIKNNGSKIPNDIQHKIFEQDFTTKEKGNGLGLAICKNQLELVNGKINLVFSNDKETVFEIVLPLS